MSLKKIFHELLELRDDMGKKSRIRAERKHTRRRAKSHIAPEHSLSSLPSPELVQQSQWANLPPELLLDIIQRLEASETSWPARRDVVACALVCRSWREITKEIVKTPEQCGWLTFPISLKQPGPRDAPIQCFIKRERETSTYRLYLGLSPALSGDMSKLLLAARKSRRATSTGFVISLVADEFSRASNTYVGKLRSNFLGSKFTIYDSQPPQNPAIQTNCGSHRRINSKQGPKENAMHHAINPHNSSSRRGLCSNSNRVINLLKPEMLSIVHLQGKKPLANLGSSSPTLDLEHGMKDPLILKNKSPRWHEQLQCWCLNFKGRVTVASVKNFQLVASAEPCHNVSLAEQEKVILQFGKIGKDIFTMDYRYPLSAFQAFAICLSSFDTKPACE
ncbi:tubby-like F-box protein 5 [Prunus yedoensis var. nudiflora]|uniref:Tubby-like F-box protein n=1 Tax=Prunus yedoensis var. nudiflora TaxID=2094558 RepID=A0A314YHW9_PRUYE|nr:tubby-like F-box protein 5 [Prunus yedoensis var. nudiflora]